MAMLNDHMVFLVPNFSGDPPASPVAAGAAGSCGAAPGFSAPHSIPPRSSGAASAESAALGERSKIGRSWDLLLSLMSCVVFFGVYDFILTEKLDNMSPTWGYSWV